MKRLVGIVTAVVLMAALPALALAGQEKKGKADSAKAMTASGTVSAVSADSLTVKGKTAEWTFTVDAATMVTASGASHKAAAAKADKKPTPITEFVHTGDTVRVSFHDMGATKHAASVSVTAKATVAK
jgi:hypothetical protein